MKDRSWIQRMLERSVPSSLRSDRGQVEVGEKEGESLSILSCVQMILLFYYPLLGTFRGYYRFVNLRIGQREGEEKKMKEMKNKEKLRIWIRSSCFTLFSFRSHFVLFFPSLLKCSSAYGTELGDRLQRTTLGASLPRWADVLGSTIKEFLGPISDGRECLIGRKSTKTSIFDAEVEEHLHSIGAAIGSCEHSFLMPLYSLIYLY